MGWLNKYPHMIYASVLLLDNRIEGWKVGNTRWNSPWEAKAYWKMNRYKDYKVQWIGWLCENDEQHEKAFIELAPKWFKQFKHAKDYKLMKAYGTVNKFD